MSSIWKRHIIHINYMYAPKLTALHMKENASYGNIQKMIYTQRKKFSQ